MNRKQQIEDNLAEAYNLLREYERLESETHDPREIQRCRNQIKRQKIKIDELKNELASVGRGKGSDKSKSEQFERLLLTQELEQLRVQSRRIQLMREEKDVVLEEIRQARECIEKLASQLSDIADLNKQYAFLRAERESIYAELPRLRAEMNRHKERIDRLVGEPGIQCPLCGQPLSDVHWQEILTQLQVEGREMGDRYRANQANIEVLIPNIARLETILGQSDRVEWEWKNEQRRLAQAEARLAEIEVGINSWESDGYPERIGELESYLQTQRQELILTHVNDAYRQAIQGLLIQLEPEQLELVENALDFDHEQELAQWHAENLINLTKHALMKLDMVQLRAKKARSSFTI